MFGFRRVTCILCDHRVERKAALAVRDRKGFAICRRCIERWQTTYVPAVRGSSSRPTRSWHISVG